MGHFGDRHRLVAQTFDKQRNDVSHRLDAAKVPTKNVLCIDSGVVMSVVEHSGLAEIFTAPKAIPVV